jgi:hypothetical protein
MRPVGSQIEESRYSGLERDAARVGAVGGELTCAGAQRQFALVLPTDHLSDLRVAHACPVSNSIRLPQLRPPERP